MTDDEERRSAPGATARARRRGLTAASITVVCWASAFVAIRVAVRSFTPEEVAWLRFASAAVVLGLIALFTRMPLPRARDLPALAGLGLVGHALYNLALAWGQARVPAASASFIISSAPIWMLVLAAATRQERPSAARVLAMLVSLAGVALIAVGRGGHLVLDPPALVVVAASVMQAVYSMGQRPLLSRYSALQVSTFTVFAALLWLTPFGPNAIRHLFERPWSHGGAALFLGVVPTAVGYSTWASAMRNLSPSSAGSFLYLVPAVVLALAWIVLGELPSGLAVTGGVLVVIGVVAVQRLRQTPRAPASPLHEDGDRALLSHPCRSGR
jgi:drug/metabolite transporter (DMT)-like permease